MAQCPLNTPLSRTHFEVLGLDLEGHSLALASKPQVLENCSALGSRTTLFFEQLKLCISLLLIVMGSGASESATVR